MHPNELPLVVRDKLMRLETQFLSDIEDAHIAFTRATREHELAKERALKDLRERVEKLGANYGIEIIYNR